MNKYAVIIGFILVIVVAVFTGVFIFNSESNIKNNDITNNILNEVNYSVKNDITIKTDTIEEKVSPNATLILKRKYKNCGHTIKEYKVIPNEIVNLTKEELEKKYEDWKIEKFTSLEVILNREEEGICDEHYILKEKDGLIAIYKVKYDDIEELEEITGISIEYLTDSDKIKIQEGIKVYGKEELNSILEDYE